MMNSGIVSALSVILMMSLPTPSALSQSDEAEGYFLQPETPSRPRAPACDSIERDCKIVGFSEGSWADKSGLWVQCVIPIAAGKAVAGVVTNPNWDVKNCYAQIEKLRQN